jgi:hypothetical protein
MDSRVVTFWRFKAAIHHGFGWLLLSAMAGCSFKSCHLMKSQAQKTGWRIA